MSRLLWWILTFLRNTGTKVHDVLRRLPCLLRHALQGITASLKRSRGAATNPAGLPSNDKPRISSDLECVAGSLVPPSASSAVPSGHIPTVSSIVLSPLAQTQTAQIPQRLLPGKNPTLATAATYPTIPVGKEVKPFHPDETGRYERKYFVSTDPEDVAIPPLATKWPQSNSGSLLNWVDGSAGEWEPCRQPEGALYFHHPDRHIYTDVYMYDDILRKEVEAFANYLDQLLLSSQMTLPSNRCELVLELRRADNGKTEWLYYYVDHRTRCLFWLDTYSNPPFLVEETKGVKTPSHMKQAIEWQYWNHWALFPNAPWRWFPSVFDDLQGILFMYSIDEMTSETSCTPYNSRELASFVELVAKIRACDPDLHNEYTRWCVARLMSLMSWWKFVNFHGERGSTVTNRGSSLNSCSNVDLSQFCFHAKIFSNDPRPRSYAIYILSPMCFFAMDVYLEELEKFWIDDIANNVAWGPFSNRLISEWSDFVIASTVILNANVAFLAIPYVGLTAQAEFPQILSYISTIASVGSITIGLFLVRQLRKSAARSKIPADFSTYASRKNRKYTPYGMELFALLYSMPYTLLMWSMAAFAAAFLSLCFKDSNIGTRITVGVALFGIMVLVLWTIGISIHLSITEMTEKLVDFGSRVKKKLHEVLT